MYEPRGPREQDRRWDADLILRLRRHLALTQREFADELNARQQTVSEWETGRYRPRGPSARLLTVIADSAEFPYGGRGPAPSTQPAGPDLDADREHGPGADHAS